MELSTNVKLVVADRPSDGIPGVTVMLYDRDQNSQDDLLGTAVTDTGGVARFHFPVEAYLDASDATVAGLAPDLYVVVKSATGETVLSTREAAVENALPSVLTVRISRELIGRYHLFPRKTRPSTQERQQEWVDAWKKPRGGKDPKPPGDLCLTRMAADILAGLSDPRTEMQMRAAKQLGEAPKRYVEGASKIGARLRDLIDSSGLIRGKRCSADATPEAVWAILTAEGGPLGSTSQALLEVEPSPHDRAGDVRAGKANTRLYDGWDTKCIAYFQAHSLTGPGLADMQSYYHEPNDLVIMDPSHVKSIAVYEHGFRHGVRAASTATKVVEQWLFDVREGLVPTTLAMDIPTTDPNCVVDFQEPTTGRQVLAVDVRPGQTVTIVGEGFISEQAKLSVLFAEWDAIPANTAGAVPLKPRTFAIAPGWPEVMDVHGSESYGNDKIVFDWPIAAAQPGLYQVLFEFKNLTGLKTITRDLQDPHTCTLGLTGRMNTEVLYFAVLPGLTPKTVKVSASKVECLDLTNPEFWPDDVGLTGAIQFTRVNYAATPSEATLTPSDQGTNDWDKGDRVLWEGDTFSPSDPNILPGGQVTRTLDFGHDFIDVVAISMTASEIEGGFDRDFLRFLSKAALITIGVIASAAVIGLAIALAAFVLTVAAAVVIVALLFACFTGFAWASFFVILGASATIAAALIGLIAAITGGVLGAIWMAVIQGAFPAVDAGINALVNGRDSVATATLALTGPELAVRMSNVRFHQKIFLFDHRVSGNVQTTTNADAQGFHETYEGSGLGGTYKMSLDLTT